MFGVCKSRSGCRYALIACMVKSSHRTKTTLVGVGAAAWQSEPNVSATQRNAEIRMTGYNSEPAGFGPMDLESKRIRQVPPTFRCESHRRHLTPGLSGQRYQISLLEK